MEPTIGLVMGSKSDWQTMEHAAQILDDFDIPHERRVVSAHRTPNWMVQYAQEAESRGLKIIIAGAGGAAHLPGMLASLTLLPVFGVPVKKPGPIRYGFSSLHKRKMPGGVPVGTLAIGDAGAKNAALLALRVLALNDDSLREKLRTFVKQQESKVLGDELP